VREERGGERDRFVHMLASVPRVRAWLEREQRAELLGAPAPTPRMRRAGGEGFAVAAEFSSPTFELRLARSALTGERRACDAEVLELMARLRLSARGISDAAADAAAGPPAVERPSCNLFYLSEQLSDDGLWAFGRIFVHKRASLALLEMLGLLSAEQAMQPDSLEIDVARFAASRVTGDTWEFFRLRDGTLIYGCTSNLARKYEVRAYRPGASLTQPGQLMRCCIHTSLTGCASCASKQGALCHCADPVLALAPRAFESWQDVASMYCASVGDQLTLSTVRGADGAILAESIAHRHASMVRASFEALPLFQCLVIDDICSRAYELPCLIENSAPTSTDCERHDCAVALGSSVHLCDHCERRFPSRFNLKRHVDSVHLGVRAHKCEACDLRFKLKSHAVAHFRQVHSHEKPHACELCVMRFATSSNLRRHVKDAHAQNRPFACEHCARAFSSKFNFDRHSLKMHGVARLER